MERLKVFVYQYTADYMEGQFYVHHVILTDEERAVRGLTLVDSAWIESAKLDSSELEKAQARNEALAKESKRKKLEKELAALEGAA